MAEYLQAPPRKKALGLLADTLTSGQNALNTVNVPYLGGLGGLLFGQAPQYLEDISYGMPAFRGGNVATGGLGTLTPDTRMLDVATLPFVGAGAAKAGQVGAKTLGKEVARQVETGTGLLGSNVLDPRQYATAYHGSPAIFDKFDINKLGSGEGAQVYGHGMYFAENPKVAKEYQNRLADFGSPYTFQYKDKIYEPSYLDNVKDPVRHAISLTYHQGKPQAQKIAKMGLEDTAKGEPYALEMGGKEYYQKMLDTAKSLSKKDIKAQQGAFYKVDIPDEHIPKMLDWDKPLKEQNFPLLDYVNHIPPSKLDTLGKVTSYAKNNNLTVNSFYDTLSKELGSAQKASEALQKAGVPGIKYLDQGSRKAGGTQNFVVFDPSNVKILERNNMGLLK